MKHLNEKVYHMSQHRLFINSPWFKDMRDTWERVLRENIDRWQQDTKSFIKRGKCAHPEI